MAFNLSQWRTMPVTVAAGVGLWAASWLWFLVYIYLLVQDADWVSRLAIALVLLSIFLVRASNWARMIALMSNAMAILFLIFLAVTLFNTRNATGAWVVIGNLAAFGLSTYCLVLPATVDFFRKHSASGSDQAQDNGPRNTST